MVGTVKKSKWNVAEILYINNYSDLDSVKNYFINKYPNEDNYNRNVFTLRK